MSQMISRVSHLTLLVLDQDEALAYYKDKLGFKVHTDVKFGDMRWLTVCTEQDPNFEVALMLAGPDNEVYVGKQGGTYPLFAFETKDCAATYQALKARGVEFNGEPKTESWGTGVGFKDLYGNVMYISQPA